MATDEQTMAQSVKERTILNLVAINAYLYYEGLMMVGSPSNGCDCPPNQIVLCVYDEGDCDRIPWPMTTADERGNLARALFDDRECRDGFPPDVEEVRLPDGELFGIEQELAIYEASPKAQERRKFWAW